MNFKYGIAPGQHRLSLSEEDIKELKLGKTLRCVIDESSLWVKVFKSAEHLKNQNVVPVLDSANNYCGFGFKMSFLKDLVCAADHCLRVPIEDEVLIICLV
ncbi:hypothetical protein KKD19_01980 [Patescibacteria group bacterium]|nr:hypothetical protein [Patescibacteria group bacterium]MBU4511995.1 hypothetical protein [Patescibacteria group bacterium]MCG2693346.1 hypothetical protein [Candidatus Parcubacteria bacterium]